MVQARGCFVSLTDCMAFVGKMMSDHSLKDGKTLECTSLIVAAAEQNTKLTNLSTVPWHAEGI
jgi:hypothetical protein